MRKLQISFLLGILLCLAPAYTIGNETGLANTETTTNARKNVSDWYIRDFHSQIVVNQNSSLDITEKRTADCGNAKNKHGIFRILPETYNLNGNTVKSHVELISITDFYGNPLKYTATRNVLDNTVIWKIGDTNKTVQGVNHYQIKYRIKNALRFDNNNFDELYWNILGNFWELEIDKF